MLEFAEIKNNNLLYLFNVDPIQYAHANHGNNFVDFVYVEYVEQYDKIR